MPFGRDTDLDGTLPVRRRRQLWLRVAGPVGGVALVIVSLLAITLYAERANRAGVLRLSDDLLRNLQERVAQQVRAYFEPATRAALYAHDVAVAGDVPQARATLELFAMSALRRLPQVDALYGCDTDGNFIMVQRGESGGLNTKTIVNTLGTRIVEWTFRDADGRVVERRLDPADHYDPRTRDWYIGAMRTDGVFWTGIYRFYTHDVPGVTAAIRFRAADGRERVFGIDMTIKALSDFLAAVRIGRSGRAVLIDDTGGVIAAPDARLVASAADSGIVHLGTGEVDDPALVATYDRYRVEGHGRYIIESGRRRYLGTAAPMPDAGRDWSLLMVVPEKDFVGFLANNTRTTLWQSVVVIVIAAGLALLLVRQGLRADEASWLLLNRGQSMERQGAALAMLGRQGGLLDNEQEEPLRDLTESLAELAGARRVGVWQCLAGGQLLYCQDAYDETSGEHLVGIQLHRRELPQFFALLDDTEDLTVVDAVGDARTAEYHRAIMRPTGTTRLCIAPVRAAGGLVGAVLLEDAVRTSDVRAFLDFTAGMLAIRLRTPGEAPAEPRAEIAGAPPPPVGERFLDSDLVLRDLAAAAGTTAYAGCAAMAIRFGDARVLGQPGPDGKTSIAEALATELQAVAAACDVPYMKFVGREVLIAAGLAPRDSSAIVRIADAAVTMRERCAEVFAATGHPPAFGIGIDLGIAVGGPVGVQPRLFNLWGEAFDTATLLATTGPGAGAIQASEAAYHRLSQHFSFYPRGSFYLPRLGAARTFILGSRQ